MFRWVSLAALIAATMAGKVPTCPDQANCLDFTIKEVGANCGSTECAFEICMVLKQDGCRKNFGSESISHTCVREPDVCTNGGGFPKWSGAEQKNVKDTSSAGTQCQLVGPGHVASFLLKDANTNDCKSDTVDFMLGSTGLTAHCEGRDQAGVSSCTGNQPKKECVWTITAPDCTTTPPTDPVDPVPIVTPAPPVHEAAQCTDLNLGGMHKFLLIGTVNKGIADAINVQNGDLGADIVTLSTAINDNVGFDLDDVFLHNAGSMWIDVDNDWSGPGHVTTGPDYLPGASRVGEGVSWTGDIALTSPTGDYSMSNGELYGMVGVVSAMANPNDSVSNSLFFAHTVGDGFNSAGGNNIINHQTQDTNAMDSLRYELTTLENWVSGLLTEKTLKPGAGLPTSDGIEDVDVFEMVIDSYDVNNDGIAVIDIDCGGNDFKITNSNWVIESEAFKTFAVIRIVGDSNLVLNQSTIMMGDGIVGNSFKDANRATSVGPETVRLNAMITKTRRTKDTNGNWKNGESTSSGDVVFNFNDVVLNGVGIYDLIHFENHGNNDGGTTEVVVNNGQGCTQFVSPKINFNNVRFERCDFGCNGGSDITRIAGVRGDPHWKRWDRKEFEWHGACDVVFIKTDNIEIQVRTEITEWWSSVQSAGVKYGTKTFQVDTDKVWLNGVVTADDQLPGEITYSTVSDVKIYEVAVSPNSNVLIKVVGPYLAVDVVGHASDFEDAVGVAGSFASFGPPGKPHDRAGNRVSTLDGYPALWKVDAAQGDTVFLTGTPKATCEMPTVNKPARRLRVSQMTNAAMEACAGKENPDGCMSDVITTGSVDIAKLW